jgi:glycerol-3-phosphate dehydrogenase (NAD(P)+)
VKHVVVVGDGGWGTAIAIHLARRGHDVGLWSHDAAYAAHLAEHRTNPRFLPGHEIPATVRVSSELGALVAGADLLVSAVPTEFLRGVWERHAPGLPPRTPILSLTKGVEQGTGLRPTQVLRALAPGRPVAVLSGPNIAWEVAKGLPATAVVGGDDPHVVTAVREHFSSKTFRVYSNPDAVGVELGGALKNVIAVAAGICDGLGLGHNAKAALLTRGVIEMARLGAVLGAERRTLHRGEIVGIAGLSGMGDLMTTCYSPTSRNRTFGERMGRGEDPKDLFGAMRQVAEGARAAAPVRDLAHRHRLTLPISEEVYLMVHEAKDPRASVEALMVRDRKDEREDLL